MIELVSKNSGMYPIAFKAYCIIAIFLSWSCSKSREFEDQALLSYLISEQSSSPQFQPSVSNPVSNNGTESVRILNISPKFGAVGTTVQISLSSSIRPITGQDLLFHESSVPNLFQSGSVITVNVPTGATTGKISIRNGSDRITSVEDFVISPWVRINASSQTRHFQAIQCIDANVCYAISQPSSTENALFFRSMDGGFTWSSPINLGINIFNVYSATKSQVQMSCPGLNTCFIVGDKSPNSEVIKISNATLPNAIVSTIKIGVANYFHYGISCTSPSYCIGTRSTGSGAIRRTTDGGINWVDFKAPFPLGFIHCIDSNTCYATPINQHNKIVKITNASSNPIFIEQDLPGTATKFRDIHCSTINSCIAVGDLRMFRLNDGSNWNEVTIPFEIGSSRYITGVACVDSSNCTIIGDRTSIWVTGDGGANWVNEGQATNEFLWSIDCISQATRICSAVGSGGFVYRRIWH